MSGQQQVSKLTGRELEVLYLIARGWDNRQIAAYLHVEIRMVKYHTTNIYSKLGVKSRSEAIVWAWKHRITQDNR
ncbi:MAG: response regulator transcription factor [Anaerolineales bacterium]|jgi:DNA-binding NarL/FixJ family response regulator|nr:response regulator transcription factor [Anaerolineales bacterium]GER81299.1 conserved hypothetical protein [Candidatus Denitrolinea symbiosum]